MIKFALILTILVSSIVLNFLLYNRDKQYYIELNDTRLDPVGLGNYPLETNQRNKTNTNQTHILPSSDVNGYEFINRGIGSSTSVSTIQLNAFNITSAAGLGYPTVYGDVYGENLSGIFVTSIRFKAK
jgi:hypothetical protein